MTCKNDGRPVFEDGLCAECYVRAAWLKVNVLDDGSDAIGVHTNDVRVGTLFQTKREAAEFTREHKRKIAEVEQEVAYMQGRLYYAQYGYKVQPIVERILAREEAALAELRRGMKEK